jgi:cytidylate kinase
VTVVAIDGPAGSGKSTIAAALAERLGVAHVDTGAYYRAATLAVLRAGAPPDDQGAVLDAVRAATLDRRGGRTCLDGADVEDEIRGPAVTASVSSISRHPAVRRHLVALQQAEVAVRGAVVEGRDAGTVVVPDADLKVWLTATPQERAARRAAQRGGRGAEAVAREAADIARRDADDAAQMARASDAFELDTTGLTVDQVVGELVSRLTPATPGTP